MKFSEPVRLPEANDFTLVRQKGSVRYYGNAGGPRLIRERAGLTVTRE